MHILRRGANAGSILPGLFNIRESAEKKAGQFAAQGIEAHVSQRNPNAFRLDIATADAMDNNTVRSLLATNTPAQVSNVSCASLHPYVKLITARFVIRFTFFDTRCDEYSGME